MLIESIWKFIGKLIMALQNGIGARNQFNLKLGKIKRD